MRRMTPAAAVFSVGVSWATRRAAGAAVMTAMTAIGSVQRMGSLEATVVEPAKLPGGRSGASAPEGLDLARRGRRVIPWVS